METIFYGVLIFILGTIIGSFLNVVILRLPKGLSLLGRSYCPGCGKTLSPRDLIPLFSYLYLKGKCRGCRKKISSRYFLIEFCCGLLFVLSFLYLNPAGALNYLILIKFLLACSFLLVIFTVDLEHYLILDKIVFPAVITTLAVNLAIDLAGKTFFASISSVFFGGIIAAIAGALLFYLLWRVSAGKWIGFGDVKLMLFLGLLAGWPYIFIVVLLASLLGTLVSLPMLFSGKKTLKSRLPFGTFLSIACLLSLFFGHSVLSWYLALIGF